MPTLPFLAVVAVVLVALLYVADATLEPSSPMIVSSDPRWSVKAMASRHDTNSDHSASTRARHDIAGGTGCSAQVRA